MQSTESLPSPTAPTSLILAASLDITWADALLGDLTRALAASGGMQIDGSLVERVATPCLQLLVAAATGARRRGQAFRIAAPSARLRAAIADLGLTDALGLEPG